MIVSDQNDSFGPKDISMFDCNFTVYVVVIEISMLDHILVERSLKWRKYVRGHCLSTFILWLSGLLKSLLEFSDSL